MPKISALPNQTAPDGADELPINDVSISTTKKITLSILKDWLQAIFNGLFAPANGWSTLSETWLYVSLDDPTGVIRTALDVTQKYSPGMRIKFTNNGNVIYGIITAVSAFTGGYTNITFLHEINPATSTALHPINNSAITLNYFSASKSPIGFPLLPIKWTVYKTDYGTIRSKASPTDGVWYELYTGIRTVVPIGAWVPRYNVKGQLNNTNASSNTVYVTLSTASATESDTNNTMSINGNVLTSGCSQYFEKELLSVDLASKTTYYLNTKASLGSGGPGTVYNRADDLATVVSFKCAYL